MYDVRDPYDDEEERRRTLEALLSGTAGEERPPEAHATLTADDFPDDQMPRTGDMPVERDYPRESVVSRSETSDGMDWQTIAALVLDAGLNRGRGMGQLLGAYSSNRTADARERRTLARQGRDSEWQRQYQERRLEGDDADRKLRERQLTEIQGRATHKNEQDESLTSGKSQTKIGLAGATADVRTRAAQAAKHELNPEMVEDAENIAEGRSTGSTRGRTDEARRNPVELTKDQEIDNARQAEQFEESKRARAATEANTRETLALKKVTERQGEYNKFRDSNKTLIDAAIKAEQLQASIDKAKGGDVPGLGFIDRNLPGGLADSEDITNRQLYAAVTNPELKRLFGASVTAGESGRADKQFGTGTFATEGEQLAAFKTMRDALRQQIAQNAVGREDIAREVLGTGEVDLSSILPPRAEAADALPEERPTADRFENAQDFVVTPGVRKGKVSAAAPEAPGELGAPRAIKVEGSGGEAFKLQSPSGATGAKPFGSEAELNAWLSAHPGWKRVR